MEAIGYVRVSTTEQVKGFGLDVQRGTIEEYCRAQSLGLVALYADEGVSGSNGLDTRDGLARALFALERGDAEVLVVARLDRLARDLLLQETIMGRMRAAGVKVLSATEADVDSEDPTRVLVRQVIGAIAQYEKAIIRARLMAGKAVKRARGGYVGGAPPFGYRQDGDRVVEEPSEQAVIAYVHAHRAEPLRDIAEGLLGAGYRPRTGERWHPETVRRIRAAVSQAAR